MNRTHGKSKTKLYFLWNGIKNRCLNPKCKTYPRYGGRGIEIQKSWIDNLELFETYIKLLPDYGKPNRSLDRIRNNEGYKEGNLRWATRTMQSRNQRMAKNNSTGYRGVVLLKSTGRFKAYVYIKRKSIHLGYADTAKEAYKLRMDYILKHQLEGFEIELP